MTVTIDGFVFERAPTTTRHGRSGRCRARLPDDRFGEERGAVARRYGRGWDSVPPPVSGMVASGHFEL